MSEVAGSTQKDSSPRDDSPYAGSPHDIEADTQARLHRVERQFAETQRIAQFGSWEWDIATDVVTWSDELYRICGVEPGTLEPTADAVISRYHPDDRGMVAEAVQRAIAERGSWALDARLVRPDGDVRWCHSRGTVIANGPGGQPRLYGVTIDITERRRSEQFLREFIGNAAHALGTPSAVILQAAHVLADSTLARSDHDAAMGALNRQATRLRELSTNLFDLVALDTGAPSVMFGLTMMLGPVKLADKVRKAADGLSLLPGVALDIDIGDDIAVLAEPAELERVFVNLLTNAQIHGGPNIAVTASRRAGEVIVEVCDDGPGIPNEYLQNLFAPFTKRQAAGHGSGLGLAIVHQLMRAFGGAVSYHRAEPRGSVFTLRFSAD